MALTITISASFGAGGTIVGRAVAERLGLAFFDRAIPATVARQLAVSDEEAELLDERAPSTWDRLARAFANMATPIEPMPSADLDDPEKFRVATERLLHQIADAGGGVVLGRAGMVILGGRPDVLCVRLDGPLAARIDRVVRSEGIDPEAAKAMQREIDGARNSYLRLFYRARQDDPSRYHLVIDSTALPLEACTELIVTAARARVANPPD